MLRTTLCPIFKHGKINRSNKDNYRGICLSSIILKVFDLIVLDIFHDNLSSSDSQFGFKQNHSTDQCTWLLKECINYYNEQNTNVYTCFLDCSKAFDCVDFIVLFKKLLKRNLPMSVTRFLLFSYANQRIVVKWGNSKSNDFSVSNGTKQGAILSFILFSVYIDDLIKLLKLKGYGCFFGINYLGVLGYADDIALLSPSRYGLQKMLDIVNQYAADLKRPVLFLRRSNIN